jgi:hypothetical protein
MNQGDNMDTKWVILDWTGSKMFSGDFNSFDDAEDFLCIFLSDSYDEDRQEYFIQEV